VFDYMKPVRRQLPDGSVAEGRPAWWYALVVQWWRLRFLATGNTPTTDDIKRAFDRSARWRIVPAGGPPQPVADDGPAR
jgi:hypothetical protein